ncbi:MAG TPA: hypothetical protein VEK11_14125 [Thermoanaerobaculia bacterium]|jgi:hypothetical protein|nr:hypothetical protein [Thermoanaerobaculia bacterium]
MRVPIDQLSNDAHIWIFGISPALDAERSRVLLSEVNAFLDDWAAHGVPIEGAAEVREGSFLIVAADDRREKSGCSIDRMFGTLRRLEQQFGVQILDSNRVFLRDGEAVRAVGRADFRNAATAETRVFDVTAERLGEVRQGAWEKPAADSWHRHLL